LKRPRAAKRRATEFDGLNGISSEFTAASVVPPILFS
jgi:hypothetical protein